MPFFDTIPAYRPKTFLMTQPARNVPSIAELGFRVVENIKVSVIMAGMLAKSFITGRDSGCGIPTQTGTLASFKTNTITVDPLEAYAEDCAETFLNTILQGMLAKGHATDSDLTGTQIEALVRAYATGGSVALNAVADNSNDVLEFQNLLNLTLNDQVTGAVYQDALRIFLLGDKASADTNYNQADGLRKKLLIGNPTPDSTSATGMYRGPAIDYAAMLADPKTQVPIFLDNLTDSASDELQDQADEQKVIYLTKGLFKLMRAFQRAFPNVESSKMDYNVNTKDFTYNGVKIKELKVWQEYMVKSFGSVLPKGTPGQPGYVPASGPSPHLALYTVPSNVIWATDLESDMETVEFVYEKRTRINWFRVLYRLGAGFAYDVLVSFAI